MKILTQVHALLLAALIGHPSQLPAKPIVQIYGKELSEEALHQPANSEAADLHTSESIYSWLREAVITQLIDESGIKHDPQYVIDQEKYFRSLMTEEQVRPAIASMHLIKKAVDHYRALLKAGEKPSEDLKRAVYDRIVGTTTTVTWQEVKANLDNLGENNKLYENFASMMPSDPDDLFRKSILGWKKDSELLQLRDRITSSVALTSDELARGRDFVTTVTIALKEDPEKSLLKWKQFWHYEKFLMNRILQDAVFSDEQYKGSVLSYWKHKYKQEAAFFEESAVSGKQSGYPK